MDLFERLQADLELRKAQGNYREMPLISYRQDNIFFDSTGYIDLASNDYLCVARDSSFVNEFFETFNDKEASGSQYAQQILTSFINSGSTGSRLLTGNQLAYTYCEDLLASLFSRTVSCPWSPDGSLPRNGIGHDRNATDEYIKNNTLSSVYASYQTQSSSSFTSFENTSALSQQDKSSSLSLEQENVELSQDGVSNRESVSRQNKVGSQDSVSRQDAARGSNFQNLDSQDLIRDCLYLNSGYDANSGIISTLFGEHDLLLVDKLAHASIIDGMLHSKAKSMRFAHNNMEHLEKLLSLHASHYANVIIVTESVFSMDGDRAKLKHIVELKKQYPNVLIYVDEAHSFGLLGEGGLGLCQELDVLDQVDFIMGTLSKAIGSQGAFLICPRVVKYYLVNYMRNFVYSTALPPFNVAFSMYMVGLLNTTIMQYRRDYLNKICNYLHLNLMEMDLIPSESQIQPLITGDNDKAAYMSEVFKHAGLLALPIRYPTVPLNKVRLRISLNCNLRIDDVDLICSLIKRYRNMFI